MHMLYSNDHLHDLVVTGGSMQRITTVMLADVMGASAAGGIIGSSRLCAPEPHCVAAGRGRLT